jgi:hypothetical protein
MWVRTSFIERCTQYNIFWYYFYEFSIKMQHMNHINSNFATINKSPTAWSLGGAILKLQRYIILVSFDFSKNRLLLKINIYEQKVQVCQSLLPWQPNSLISHLQKNTFYFCFHGNHSHNLRLKVYLVVSLVISYVKKIISVNTF